jgi:hypothetical protein
MRLESISFEEWYQWRGMLKENNEDNNIYYYGYWKGKPQAEGLARVNARET